MNPIVFENGAVEIDAAIVAEALGIPSPLLLERMRAGTISGVCEQGIDEDRGRHRLTFRSGRRRIRLVIDEAGTIIQRSAIDFGERTNGVASP